MVRIRFPPAVNQANFRIAPLAGPLPLGPETPSSAVAD